MKKELIIYKLSAKSSERTQWFINILDTEKKMIVKIINRMKDSYYTKFHRIVLYNTIGFSATRGSAIVAYGKV